MPAVELPASEIEKISHQSIIRALNGEPPHAITGDRGLYSGSDWLNAHTIGCFVLSKFPNYQFVNEPLNIPKGSSRIQRTVTTFLNQTTLRNATNKLSFRMTRLSGEDACIESEGRFLDAMGHTNTDEFMISGNKVTKLFTDRHDNLVLIKKGMKIPTAIGARALVLNGIQFPAGTLYQVAEHTKQAPMQLNDTVEAHSTVNIRNLVPLRMSAFIFDPDERAEIFSEDSLLVPPVETEHIPRTQGLTITELITPVHQLLSSEQPKR